MPTPPPKVHPAMLSNVEGGNLFAATTADVTQAFRLFVGALSYWLPHGLNQAMQTARAARTIR